MTRPPAPLPTLGTGSPRRNEERGAERASLRCGPTTSCSGRGVAVAPSLRSLAAELGVLRTTPRPIRSLMTAREWASVLVFTLTAGFVYLVLVEPQRTYLEPLAARARATNGTITKVDWRNHVTRTYEYVVEGTRHAGETFNGPAEVGSPVTVYYLPDRPAHSVIGEAPITQLDRLWRESWICLAFGAVVAVVVWWRFPEGMQRLTTVYEGPHRSKKGAPR